MASLRDIALTVEERANGEFFWMLLEATANDKPDEFLYLRVGSAAAPQKSYSSALAMGVAAMRKVVEAA
ncbi:MAG: hypothetical protein KJ901_24670 [Gammaproteobacteria bacterium]|nr:hypothetical protein [Gammaproteobacteria bacterium]MBU1439930.1 hypothetical protein [Gammaproteobacteria bacterium]